MRKEKAVDDDIRERAGGNERRRRRRRRRGRRRGVERGRGMAIVLTLRAEGKEVEIYEMHHAPLS
jgi:hypothetical protein